MRKIYSDFYEMMMDVKNDIDNGVNPWIDYDYEENIHQFYKDESSEGHYYVNELFNLDNLAVELAKLQLEDPGILVMVVYNLEIVDDQPVILKAIHAFKNRTNK